MKKIKPIKRSEHIVSISREHHATLLFCWKLRQGVKMKIAPERIESYVIWFWEHHMKTHFHAEERLLFTNSSEPMIKKALDEHQAILDGTLQDKDESEEQGYERFLQLADLVDDHTRYEERELFPWIEQNFEETRLIEIGKILESEEHSADENYNDEFWIIQK